MGVNWTQHARTQGPRAGRHEVLACAEGLCRASHKVVELCGFSGGRPRGVVRAARGQPRLRIDRVPERLGLSRSDASAVLGELDPLAKLRARLDGARHTKRAPLHVVRHICRRRVCSFLRLERRARRAHVLHPLDVLGVRVRVKQTALVNSSEHAPGVEIKRGRVALGRGVVPEAGGARGRAPRSRVGGSCISDKPGASNLSLRPRLRLLLHLCGHKKCAVDTQIQIQFSVLPLSRQPLRAHEDAHEHTHTQTESTWVFYDGAGAMQVVVLVRVSVPTLLVVLVLVLLLVLLLGSARSGVVNCTNVGRVREMRKAVRNKLSPRCTRERPLVARRRQKHVFVCTLECTHENALLGTQHVVRCVVYARHVLDAAILH